MTPERAREIIGSQAMRGFGAEIQITSEERTELWALVSAAPVNMSVRDMVCRIARGESGEWFSADIHAAGDQEAMAQTAFRHRQAGLAAR